MNATGASEHVASIPGTVYSSRFRSTLSCQEYRHPRSESKVCGCWDSRGCELTLSALSIGLLMAINNRGANVVEPKIQKGAQRDTPELVECRASSCTSPGRPIGKGELMGVSPAKGLQSAL